MYPTRVVDASESSCKVDDGNPLVEVPASSEDGRKSVLSWENEESSGTDRMEIDGDESDENSPLSEFGLSERIVTDNFLPI